jgi:hypothetical protein
VTFWVPFWSLVHRNELRRLEKIRNFRPRRPQTGGKAWPPGAALDPYFPGGKAAIMSSSMRAPGVDNWLMQIVVLAGVHDPKYSLSTATIPS